MIASIPGHGIGCEKLVALNSKLGAFKSEFEERRAEIPGIFSDPDCNQDGGISLPVTSCKLFLDTGNRVDKLMGRGLW